MSERVKGVEKFSALLGVVDLIWMGVSFAGREFLQKLIRQSGIFDSCMRLSTWEW